MSSYNELIVQTKDDKQLVYVPEKCIGCGTCILTCPKDSIVIGSVGAVARGLVDQDFLEHVPDTCIVCGMCAKVCPTGALEIRVAGEPVKDETYLCGAIKPTTVSDDCVHCGLCEEVCPQDAITVRDGSRKRTYFKERKELLGKREVPAWLSLDEETMDGRVLALPTRQEIDVPVAEQLIVEFYSR